MSNVRSYRIYLPAESPGGAGTVSIDLSVGIIVTKVWFRKEVNNATGADLVTLQDGNGNSITNTMNVQVNEDTLVRATSIDTTFSTVTAAENLQVAYQNNSGNPNFGGAVYVEGIPTNG